MVNVFRPGELVYFGDNTKVWAHRTDTYNHGFIIGRGTVGMVLQAFEPTTSDGRWKISLSEDVLVLVSGRVGWIPERCIERATT